MHALLMEILIYFIFLIIVSCICYGSTDPSIYYMKQHFKSTFALSGTSDTKPFLQITNSTDLWNWVNEILVPEFFNTLNYNDTERSIDMKGTLPDSISYIMGHLILRQIRVKKGKCTVPIEMRKHVETCTGYSQFYNEEEGDFGRSWNVTGAIVPFYKYRSPIKIKGVPYKGRLDTYGGGGYLAVLRGPIEKAAQLAKDLQDEQWIDKYTRAFFAEFAVYNPQVNLFGTTMFVAEFLPGGGIKPSFVYKGLNIFRYHNGAGLFVLSCEIGFLIFTLVYSRREFRVIKKLKCSYFECTWNCMEFCALILSYIGILMYLMKIVYVSWILKEIENTDGKRYVRMFSLAMLDETLKYVLGFLLFIATLKTLKLLKFNKRIGFLSATLKVAVPDISAFGLVFLITLVMFTAVFYIKVNTSSWEFSSVSNTLQTCFFLITQKFKIIHEAAPIMGPLFYFIFAFIMHWVVFQLLIAIICRSFSKVKEDVSKQPNDFEVIDYIVDKITRIFHLLTGGNKVQQMGGKVPVLDDHINSIHFGLMSITNKLKKMDASEDNLYYQVITARAQQVLIRNNASTLHDTLNKT